MILGVIQKHLTEKDRAEISSDEGHCFIKLETGCLGRTEPSAIKDLTFFHSKIRLLYQSHQPLPVFFEPHPS